VNLNSLLSQFSISKGSSTEFNHSAISNLSREIRSFANVTGGMVLPKLINWAVAE